MRILQKTPGKDFTVLNLTDLHMYNADWQENSEKCIHLKATVDALIARTEPDLITVSGDFAYAGNDYAYRCYARWLDGYRIPWAPVWGNHDNQNGPEYISRIAELFMSTDYCIFEKGDPALGCGNYVILIEEAHKPLYALFMLDSHDRSCCELNGELKKKWDHLWPEQMLWYESQVKQLAYVKNAIITHIPLYCYKYAFTAAWNPEFDPKAVTLAESHNPKYWNDGYKTASGITHEGVNSHPIDTHEYDVIRGLGATDLMIVGHDHIDNFIIDYQGITFVYALKTGHGAYHDPELNGGTVIRLSGSTRRIEHIYIP